MLTKVLYKAVLMFSACCWLAACSQDDGVTASAGNDTGVRLRFSVTENGSTTRAEDEDGWNGEWNENKITRLDLFQFQADEAETLRKHYEPTLSSNPFDFEATNNTYYEMEVEGLTYQDLITNSTDKFYLVANCPQLKEANISTLSDLKAAMIAPDLNVYGKQSSFVMDAKTTSDDKDLYVIDETQKQITLSFQLYRAAAKIRLAVKSASTDGKGKDILAECEYQLYNTVADGTSVLAESEKYGKGTEQELSPEEEMRSFQTIYNNTEKNINQAVFYSYPNSWFDEGKVSGSDDKWTITDFTSKTPIDTKRQTYILLKAPFGDTDYYYKVPVNYALYKDNDATSFTNEQLEEIRDLYRINRNHLYDITVTIDREGGSLTEPVTPKFHILVEDWKEGGSYEISDGEFQEDSEKSGD